MFSKSRQHVQNPDNVFKSLESVQNHTRPLSTNPSPAPSAAPEQDMLARKTSCPSRLVLRKPQSQPSNTCTGETFSSKLTQCSATSSALRWWPRAAPASCLAWVAAQTGPAAATSLLELPLRDTLTSPRAFPVHRAPAEQPQCKLSRTVPTG
jgi:hypothetical protein